MPWMFYNSPFNGDISKWNTHEVGLMSNMFEKSKFSKDISKWDVGLVLGHGNMFKDCPLESKPQFQPQFKN